MRVAQVESGAFTACCASRGRSSLDDRDASLPAFDGRKMSKSCSMTLGCPGWRAIGSWFANDSR